VLLLTSATIFFSQRRKVSFTLRGGSYATELDLIKLHILADHNLLSASATSDATATNTRKAQK